MGAYGVETFMGSHPSWQVEPGNPTKPGGGWTNNVLTAGQFMTFGRFDTGVPGGCTIFYSQHLFNVTDRGWFKHYRGAGITDGNTYNHWANLGRYFQNDHWLDDGSQAYDVTVHTRADYGSRWDTHGWEKYDSNEVFRGDVRQQTWYGYNLNSFNYSTGVRYIQANWGGVGGADGYDIHLDGTYMGRTAWNTYAWGYGGQKSGAHRIRVTPAYLLFGNWYNSSNAGSDYNVTIGAGQAGAPTGTNAAIRRRITFKVPAQYVSSDNYKVTLNNASTSVTGVGQSSAYVVCANGGTVTIDYSNQPDGTYTTYAQAAWNDGDAAAWTAGNTVVLATPTIKGLGSTSGGTDRTMTVTWTQITDMTSYTVKLDSNTTVSIPQTPNSTGTGTVPSTSITYSYIVGSSGSLINITFANIKSGPHTTVVTPVQTGYSGSVVTGTTSGGAGVPTPDFPTIAANTPTGRQLVVTAPMTNASQLPAGFFSAQSWDIRRDMNDATIVNTTNINATLSQVPNGPHTAQIRARWSDGDISPWSASSSSVTSVTPSLTAATALQRSAPTAAPICVVATTGGTIPINTYYVVVSINKAANKTTDAAHPDTTRNVNESTPSLPATVSITVATSTITIPQPTGMSAGDSWNAYIGTDRNVLNRGRGVGIAENIPFNTTPYVLTSYTVEGNKAKIGKTDLAWIAPTGTADAPVSYKVERAPMNGSDPLTGTPGSYIDVTNRAGYAGFYSTTKFWEDRLDTRYYYYRIYAVYSNETTPAVELVV